MERSYEEDEEYDFESYLEMYPWYRGSQLYELFVEKSKQLSEQKEREQRLQILRDIILMLVQDEFPRSFPLATTTVANITDRLMLYYLTIKVARVVGEKKQKEREVEKALRQASEGVQVWKIL